MKTVTKKIPYISQKFLNGEENLRDRPYSSRLSISAIMFHVNTIEEIICKSPPIVMEKIYNVMKIFV